MLRESGQSLHPEGRLHCPDGAVPVPGGWSVPPPTKLMSLPGYLPGPLPSSPRPPPSGPAMPDGGAVIDMCLLAPELLQGYIDFHPEVLTQKGFNGQTLLHRAVLSAPSEAVEIILDNGGDPNAKNNYAETPVHFACKRGNPEVIHMLMQKGGDVTLVDYGGKGTILHAAHSGAVPMLHYLSTVVGLSLQAVDKDGNSALHISCTHGHAEAVVYLLKNERSNIHQCNSAGNTPLHIAALHGHSMACWQLLQAGGIPVLHQPNSQGLSPVDLAKQGTQPKFVPVVIMLDYYSKMLKGGRGQKIAGPQWVWWLMLFQPFLLYALGLGATHCVPSHAGFLMLGCMVTILLITMQQGHRLKHMCRWPNPMFMGMFAAGLFHTTICYYAVLFPELYPDHLATVVFTVVYNVVIFSMYYRLLTGDPGVVKRSEVKPNGEEYSILDVGTGTRPVQAFCKACEIVPPQWTKHCKLCETCYIGMDHHCLFLYRCVARNNHRLFVNFIIVVLFAQMLFIYFGLLFLQERVSDRVVWRMKVKLWAAFHQHSWLWSTMVANFLSILWGVNLLHYQFKVVGKGHTTYFQPGRGTTRLGWAQRALNVVYFLLGRKPYRVDPQLLAEPNTALETKRLI